MSDVNENQLIEDISNQIETEFIENQQENYESLLLKAKSFASPLASKKLFIKICKLLSQALQHKNVRRGSKEVTKTIKNNKKGIVLLGGDTSPVDCISHLPIYCEDNKVPYVFVASCSMLSKALGVTNFSQCAMILPSEEYEEAYNICWDRVINLLIYFK